MHNKEVLHIVKVIMHKSRGEVSLVEQDTVENVSQPTLQIYSMYFLRFLRVSNFPM